MKKMPVMLDLADKIFLMRRLDKLYIFFQETNRILFFYHRKIVQKSYAVNWPQNLESVFVLVQVVVSV